MCVCVCVCVCLYASISLITLSNDEKSFILYNMLIFNIIHSLVNVLNSAVNIYYEA